MYSCRITAWQWPICDMMAWERIPESKAAGRWACVCVRVRTCVHAAWC